MNYLEKLKDINTFIFDVDGVFTNSQLLIQENGDLLRSMSTRDGFMIKEALKAGYRIVIITGGSSTGVVKRLTALGIQDIFSKIHHKAEIFRSYIRQHGIDAGTVLYMGDDIPDYAVMRLVGLPACPNDAVPEIKQISRYISPKNGGEGCVRDIIEKVMKVQEKWDY